MKDSAEILNTIKNQYIFPPPTNRRKTKLQDPRGYVSPAMKRIQNLFENKTEKGFFFEAGALDGMMSSNTLWVEQERNWTGLLIETNPQTCDILRNNSRNAYVSCTCIDTVVRKTTIEIPVSKTKEKEMFFLSNTRLMDSEFHTFHDKVYKQKKKFDYAEVQCFPLASYFFALGVTRVDLLSIDIQGREREILLTFPFDKIFVRYIVAEHYQIENGIKSRAKKDMKFIKEITAKGFFYTGMTADEDYFFKNIKS